MPKVADVCLLGIHHRTQPKVGDLASEPVSPLSVLLGEGILWLQVNMDDILLMKVLNTTSDFFYDSAKILKKPCLYL